MYLLNVGKYINNTKRRTNSYIIAVRTPRVLGDYQRVRNVYVPNSLYDSMTVLLYYLHDNTVLKTGYHFTCRRFINTGEVHSTFPM